MLDFKRVIASAPRKRAPETPRALLTPWGAGLDPCAALQGHPRPQFARDGIEILNGRWDYAIVPAPAEPSATAGQPVSTEPPVVPVWQAAMPPARYDGEILVPFSPEAPLSGVNRQLKPGELLWYRRTFATSERAQGSRLLLHFEAVDHACSCSVNGVLVGTHTGGYLPFSFDVTDALAPGGQSGPARNELVLCVCDPSDAGTQPRGKQRLESGGIWYTAQSGIWQTVWLEEVPETRLESVAYETDLAGRLVVSAQVVGAATLEVRVFAADGRCVASASLENPRALRLGEALPGALRARTPFLPEACDCLICELAVPNPHLWSPSDPYLYQVELRYGDDVVHSYCAFRTVEVRPDARGVARFHLNGQPLFLRGVLDQGYWSDGLLTAPSDDALVYDIKTARDLGFNLMRKHIKIESDRWYYHCDRLGMLVWQDMVSGGGTYSAWHTSYKPTLFSWSWGRYRDDAPAHVAALAADDPAFQAEWNETCLGAVRHLRNHPCIVTWALFNEAWGQFDASAAVEAVRAVDGTRPVNATSGWYDQGVGDYLAEHNYFRDLRVRRDTVGMRTQRRTHSQAGPRAFVIAEFGGLTHHVEDHSVFSSDYGYAVYRDIREFRCALNQLLAQVDALEAQGLAGFVYTQLSDVEEETNGLLTFDRCVNKLVDNKMGAIGSAVQPEACR